MDRHEPPVFCVADMMSTPQTGGEQYNFDLFQGARAAGADLRMIDGAKYSGVLRSIPMLNAILFVKAIALPARSVVMFDLGFCSRCIALVLWAKYFRRVSVVGLLHHYNYFDRSSVLSKAFHYVIESIASRCCDFLVTNSRFSKRSFEALTGRRIPIFINPPAVKCECDADIAPANFQAAKQRLLFVGNVEHRKNVLNIIRALSLVKTDCHLDIVGRCPDRKYLELLRQQVSELGLGERVCFHGRVDRESIADFYSQSTVFVLVSRMEGYGISYAEAMRFGLPIVGTCRGAVPEMVVDGQNGFLCDPDSPKEIAAAIDKCSLSKTWQAMSDRNLDRFRTFVDRKSFRKKSGELVLEILHAVKQPQES